MDPTSERQRAAHSEAFQQKAKHARGSSEEQMRLLLDGVKDYAIFMLDPEGYIASWSPAAERLKGWTSDEIIGRHFSIFFPKEDAEAGKPERELRLALQHGRWEDESWRVRKDGSPFWANVVITPLYDATGALRGFAKVTRDLTDRKRAEDELRAAKESAEAANRELETFSYSVSHDLRSPLRGIDGFSKVLLEEYAAKLDDRGKEYLTRVRAAAQRMGMLIDDVLRLSRLTRTEMRREEVDLSALGREVVAESRAVQPDRQVEVTVQDGMTAMGDPVLLRQALANLVDNAFKFTRTAPRPRIEIGMTDDLGCVAYFVRDNGAGFDMAYSGKLFGAFQRLHSANEFPGSGIGLASVQRIVHRHRGEVWAEGRPGEGATFWFTVGCHRPHRK